MMPGVSTVPFDGDRDELCVAASERAHARGHELGGWSEPPEEEGIARAAACVRCGRVAYVRSEGGLVGAAGAALTEACDGSA